MQIDTRLLLIFHSIYRFQSVSKASEFLNIGQPTVSIGLNKLRDHFKDPLFVRVSNTMQPTELSKSIYPVVSETLEQLKFINDFNLDFDPKTSDHEFNISMTDISHLALLPKLLNYLRGQAPQIRLNIIPIDINTQNKMVNGDIDLAIGFIPQLESGFYQQTLFKQHYVGIASKNHPRLKSNFITKEQYKDEQHIDILATGGHYVLEHELQKLGVKRDIILRLPSYLGVGQVVQDTDVIATIPNYLSSVLLQNSRIKVIQLPYVFPTYSVKQHWHSRVHKNPSNQWLRQTCFQLFST